MKLSPQLQQELQENEAKLEQLGKERKRIEEEIVEVVKNLEIIYRVIKELKRNEDNQEAE